MDQEKFSNKEDKNVLKQAEKMVKRGRSSLVLLQVFYATLLFKLDTVPDWNAGTAYTDGRVIGYNPNYIVSLTMDNVRALLIHEVMHVAFGHHLRKGNREHTKWNWACDYAINWIIDQLDGFGLMDGALNSPAFADKNMEWIYKQLPDPPKGSAVDKGGMGEIRPWKNEDGKKPSEAQIKEEEGNWKVAVGQAQNVAKAAGKLPAGFDRWIKKLLKPRVNVHALLIAFLIEAMKGDFSWKAPNKRYMATTGIYLPSLQPAYDKLQRGAYIVDSSGSITVKELRDTASIIWEIVTKFDMELDVFSVDSKLQPNGKEMYQVVDSYTDPTKLNLKGGGGTCFKPAFNYMDKEGIDPVFAVYFTDGHCNSYPKKHPYYPVIWLLHTENDNFNPPFGEVVRMEG